MVSLRKVTLDATFYYWNTHFSTYQNTIDTELYVNSSLWTFVKIGKKLHTMDGTLDIAQ